MAQSSANRKYCFHFSNVYGHKQVSNDKVQQENTFLLKSQLTLNSFTNKDYDQKDAKLLNNKTRQRQMYSSPLNKKIQYENNNRFGLFFNKTVRKNFTSQDGYLSFSPGISKNVASAKKDYIQQKRNDLTQVQNVEKHTVQLKQYKKIKQDPLKFKIQDSVTSQNRLLKQTIEQLNRKCIQFQLKIQQKDQVIKNIQTSNKKQIFRQNRFKEKHLQLFSNVFCLKITSKDSGNRSIRPAKDYKQQYAYILQMFNISMQEDNHFDRLTIQVDTLNKKVKQLTTKLTNFKEKEKQFFRTNHRLIMIEKDNKCLRDSNSFLNLQLAKKIELLHETTACLQQIHLQRLNQKYQRSCG